MFQVQGSSEPDPLLATLEKYVCLTLSHTHSNVNDMWVLTLVRFPSQTRDCRAAAVQYIRQGEERIGDSQRDPDPPHTLRDTETSVSDLRVMLTCLCHFK